MPRPLSYLWTFPTTCLGLLFVPLRWLGGGEIRVVDGVMEIHGRWIAWMLEHLTLLPGGAAAMTLGHVVIGRNQEALDRSRSHERVHVRQCERWGPFFIPAYLGASLIIWIRGADAYRDNPFEREAYEQE